MASRRYYLVKKVGLYHLLKLGSNGVDFSGIFEEHVKNYNFLKHWHSPFVSSMSKTLPDRVGLVFLDLSKEWQDFIPILGHIFPRLTIGANVVFQDYGYCEAFDIVVIAALLTDRDILIPTVSAATSVCFRLNKAISCADYESIISFFVNDKKSPAIMNTIIETTMKILDITKIRIDVKRAIVLNMLVKLKAQQYSLKALPSQKDIIKYI